MTKNPHWTENELVLVLDLYFRTKPNIPGKKDARVAEVVKIMEELYLISNEGYFRTEGSVLLRMSNYLALDPDYKGAGMKNSGEQAKEIWDKYNSNQDLLKEKIEHIHEIIKDEKKMKIKNRELEYLYHCDINDSNFDDLGITKLYSLSRRKMPKKEIIEGKIYYIRDKNVSINALNIANHKCEIDNNHCSFIRKTNNKTYMEPHHLIPISNQPDFDSSLDTEENIVSLCSNCHNMIHYGKDSNVLIEKLYNQRKELLKNKGIYIELDKLLEYYK